MLFLLNRWYRFVIDEILHDKVIAWLMVIVGIAILMTWITGGQL